MSGFFHLTRYSENWSILEHVSVLYSFSSLNNLPLCTYIMFYLFIHPLIDIWVFLQSPLHFYINLNISFWISNKFCVEYVLISVGLYLRENFCHKLTVWRTECFSKVAAPFHISISNLCVPISPSPCNICFLSPAPLLLLPLLLLFLLLLPPPPSPPFPLPPAFSFSSSSSPLFSLQSS